MGYVEKRGSMWTARYRDSGKRQLRQSGFRTQREARKWLDQRLEEQREGVIHDRKTTLSLLIDTYLEQHEASERRIEKLTGCLKHAKDADIGSVPVVELTPQMLAAWRKALPTEHVKHDAFAALKQVLKTAVLWRMIGRNPADGIKNPQPAASEQYPFRDWDEVLSVDAEMPEWCRGWIVAIVGTGLRPQEWTQLEWHHVDLEMRRLHVPASIAKTGEARTVPLRQAVVDVLLPRRRYSGPLFPGRDGRPFDMHNWRGRAWNKAQQKANAKRVKAGLDEMPMRRPYDMRHTYATWALRAGFNTFTLARRMGTSIAMIDRTYGHLAHDSEDHELGLLDRFDGPRMQLGAKVGAATSTTAAAYLPEPARASRVIHVSPSPSRQVG